MSPSSTVQRAAQVAPTPAVATPDPAPARAATPPSARFAEAMSSYARGEHARAGAALRDVIEGTTDDSAETVLTARFTLAKSLFHLGLYHASAIVLAEVTADAGAGGRHDAAVVWLAALAERIPHDPLLVEIASRFDAAAIERALGGADRAEQRAHVFHLAGRARYDAGELDAAIRFFRRVPRGSEHHVSSRFLEATSYVRKRRARPAIAAFRSIIDAIDDGDDGGVDDPRRLRELAWLSLGRVYYTAAHSHDDAGALTVDGRLLGAAVDAWARVPERSEYWLDALFEASWALFLADEDGRALGRIHALRSPFFPGAHHPEADVIRAVVLFSKCQLEATRDEISAFHRRFDPVLRELRRLRASHSDNDRAHELLLAVRSHHAPVSVALAPVLERELGDRELSRRVALTGELAAEERRAMALADTPALATLGAWAGQELAVARALAEDGAGEMTLARLDRLTEELAERTNDMDAVELEVMTMLRTSPPGPDDGEAVSIIADQEHMIWPFDGEYWRDEVPYYRATVRNRCTR